MGDMGEGWAEWRQAKQEKKRSNMAYSTRQLREAGIEFTMHNSGIHLVLKKGENTIDFWPSTGLWWVRGAQKKCRGITRLITYMKRREA
jgi:hypothetical protein